MRAWHCLCLRQKTPTGSRAARQHSKHARTHALASLARPAREQSQNQNVRPTTEVAPSIDNRSLTRRSPRSCTHACFVILPYFLFRRRELAGNRQPRQLEKKNEVRNKKRFNTTREMRRHAQTRVVRPEAQVRQGGCKTSARMPQLPPRDAALAEQSSRLSESRRKGRPQSSHRRVRTMDPAQLR